MPFYAISNKTNCFGGGINKANRAIDMSAGVERGGRVRF